MAIDWKDQTHKAAGRTDNVLWTGSPMNIFGDGGATGAVEVLAAQNARVGLQIQNVGASTVYLGFDNTVQPAGDASPKYAVRLLTGEAWWVYLGEGIPVNSVFAVCESGVTSKLAFYELF
jgi:hypothetical protein